MAIALTMNRNALRQLAAAIACIMMIASFPSVGVIVVADKSGPTLTMDICHPLQAGDRSSTAVALARPAPPKIASNSVSKEALFQLVSVQKGKIVVFPDSPPPKLS
jgi:hypothetical protein